MLNAILGNLKVFEEPCDIKKRYGGKRKASTGENKRRDFKIRQNGSKTLGFDEVRCLNYGRWVLSGLFT